MSCVSLATETTRSDHPAPDSAAAVDAEASCDGARNARDSPRKGRWREWINSVPPDCDDDSEDDEVDGMYHHPHYHADDDADENVAARGELKPPPPPPPLSPS